MKKTPPSSTKPLHHFSPPNAPPLPPPKKKKQQQQEQQHPYHLPPKNNPSPTGAPHICSACTSSKNVPSAKSSRSRSKHPLVAAHFLGARNSCRPLILESAMRRSSTRPPSSSEAKETPDFATWSKAGGGRIEVRTYLCGLISCVLRGLVWLAAQGLGRSTD